MKTKKWGVIPEKLYTPIYKKKKLTKAVMIKNGKVVKTISANAYMDLMFGKEFMSSAEGGMLKAILEKTSN